MGMGKSVVDLLSQRPLARSSGAAVQWDGRRLTGPLRPGDSRLGGVDNHGTALPLGFSLTGHGSCILGQVDVLDLKLLTLMPQGSGKIPWS